MCTTCFFRIYFIIIISSIIIVIINIKVYSTSFIKTVLISTQNFFPQFSSPRGGVLEDGVSGCTVFYHWLGLNHSSPGQAAGQPWYFVPSSSPSPPKIEEELARVTVSVLHLPVSCLALLSFSGTVYKTSDENYIQSLPLFTLEKRRGPHHSIPEPT